MFKELKKYPSIVVTAPQRAGTRIVAKAIAQDTGHEYIDESEIHNQDIRLLEWYLSKGNVVIQCPALMHKILDIAKPKVLIIVVRRPIDEIVASEKRIGWQIEARQSELIKYGYTGGIVSKVKYDYWINKQMPELDRLKLSYLEVNYHDLEKHPLWVKNRKNFTWEQTS